MNIERYELRECLNLLCEGMLTENMKQMLREKYVYGYTVNEMAVKRDMTSGMIRHRISKIKSKLKWAYEEYIEEGVHHEQSTLR